MSENFRVTITHESGEVLFDDEVTTLFLVGMKPVEGGARLVVTQGMSSEGEEGMASAFATAIKVIQSHHLGPMALAHVLAGGVEVLGQVHVSGDPEQESFADLVRRTREGNQTPM